MTGRTLRGSPRFASLLCAAAVTVSGCAREEPYLAPAFNFLPSFKNSAPSVPVYVADTAWWRSFKDPALNALVSRALGGNIDLALARERAIEARANAGTIPADYSLTPSASVRYQGGSATEDGIRAEAGLNFSWLIDPWGVRFHQRRAALARAEAAEIDIAASQLLVLLALGEAYVEMRYQERLLELREQEVARRSEMLRLTRTLQEQESGTRLDVVRAEARLSESQRAIPDIRAAIAAQRYRIAVILGTTPGTLGIGGGGQPVPTLSPNVGIPADLLRNRPDIRGAERLYYAAVADVGAARGELYPRLSLGGAISLATINGSDATSYFFGPSLTLPSLPGDDRRAAVEARESRARQAHLSWQQTVLEGILDVETALKRYAEATRAVAAAQRTVQLYRDASGLTRELVLNDSATIRELLDAEESVSEASLALAAARRAQALAYVQLNVAIGAGHSFGQSADVASLK